MSYAYDPSNLPPGCGVSDYERRSVPQRTTGCAHCTNVAAYMTCKGCKRTTCYACHDRARSDGVCVPWINRKSGASL